MKGPTEEEVIVNDSPVHGNLRKEPNPLNPNTQVVSWQCMPVFTKSQQNADHKKRPLGQIQAI